MQPKTHTKMLSLGSGERNADENHSEIVFCTQTEQAEKCDGTKCRRACGAARTPRALLVRGEVAVLLGEHLKSVGWGSLCPHVKQCPKRDAETVVRNSSWCSQGSEHSAGAPAGRQSTTAKAELPGAEQPGRPECLYRRASFMGVQSVRLGPAQV